VLDEHPYGTATVGRQRPPLTNLLPQNTAVLDGVTLLALAET
jgi:hypothetical protein